MVAGLKSDPAQLFATGTHYVSSEAATFVQPSVSQVRDLHPQSRGSGLIAFPAVGDVHHDTIKGIGFS